MEKPSVRLESHTSLKKQKTPVPKGENVKLAIRLNEAVNDALRGLIRYRGDLSAMAIEALTSVDLGLVALVSSDETMVRDTTITLPKALHKRVKKVAQDRATSMNIMVSTGLAHWLNKKGALKLR
jgi:hypothetical protein